MLILNLRLRFPTVVKINTVLLNTLIKLCTVVASTLDALIHSLQSFGFQASEPAASSVPWVTISTTSLRWEAELMQQVLVAHGIPARIVALGIGPYMGQGSPAALQVHAEHEPLAHLLLSVVDEATEASD